jgi:molybdopterin-binding protein
LRCERPRPGAPARLVDLGTPTRYIELSIATEELVKISARNRLKGRIVEVKKGATTAHVRLDVNGTIVTASITNEAVDELKLKAGDTAYAVVKASDVMIGLD